MVYSENYIVFKNYDLSHVVWLTVSDFSLLVGGIPDNREIFHTVYRISMDFPERGNCTFVQES